MNPVLSLHGFEGLYTNQVVVLRQACLIRLPVLHGSVNDEDRWVSLGLYILIVVLSCFEKVYGCLHACYLHHVFVRRVPV